MAEIICVIGNKGGTGKTTLSHMLSQGLGLLGHRAACVLTDTSREPLSPAGRRYITADARTREALTKVVDKLRSLDGWLGVIDGGGNRTEMDRKLYAMSDIVLLPFRESHEDIRTVVRDLEMFPRAYAVPTQWPTNAWQREAVDRSVAQLMGAYRHRILNPVLAPDIGSVLISESETIGIEKQISLNTTKIQEMVSGAFTNNGFIIIADTELNDRFNCQHRMKLSTKRRFKKSTFQRHCCPVGFVKLPVAPPFLPSPEAAQVAPLCAFPLAGSSRL